MTKSIEVIDTSTTDFIGIGKFFIETQFEWNIPHLHFIISKNSDGTFEATNLELMLSVIADTDENAIKKLGKLTISHITQVMKERIDYKQFEDAFDSHLMADFWRAYRNIEIKLAKKRNDVSHNFEQRLVQAIQQELGEQIKQEINNKAQKTADEIIDDYEKRRSAVSIQRIDFAKIDAMAA